MGPQNVRWEGACLRSCSRSHTDLRAFNLECVCNSEGEARVEINYTAASSSYTLSQHGLPAAELKTSTRHPGLCL